VRQAPLNARATSLEYESESLASGLPALMVEAERLASATSLGVHGRRKAGMGETFWQFRRYRAEDPSTAVDWRQSAKSTHLYVREREWEAAQAVWFLCDRSAGMFFGSGGTRKVDRAALLTAALAVLMLRGGERIALFGDARPPQSSRIALRRMLLALADPAPAQASMPQASLIGKNGQLMWLSDFLFPHAVLSEALARFVSLGVQGHLIHVIDPQEEDFPFTGRTRFDDPGGRQSETIGRAENVASRYRARFRAHGEEVARLARRQNFSYLAHRTDRPPQTALVAMYAAVSG